jgi:hypothetical protein
LCISKVIISPLRGRRWGQVLQSSNIVFYGSLIYLFYLEGIETHP